jgi:uncharacterized alpha-E superfamily protein
MLSRTADNLFWLARYLERADHLARLIVATRRLSALPKAYGGQSTEWESVLESAGALDAFKTTEAEVNEDNAIDFLAFSPANPSSIRNCLESARFNARSVRTALTAEMWESVNSGYLELRSLELGAHPGDRLNRVIELAQRMSLAYDGGADRTMLRNDAYYFSQLGLFVERADNTARLLDVKYHVLLPDKEAVGGSLDYFQWSTILRAVSAHTAYHWVYRQALRPWLVADLLVLKREMPRSLIACSDNVVLNLDRLARSHGKQGAAQRQARASLARLESLSTDRLIQSGLHEFLDDFISGNNRLGELIAEQYLFA